MYMLELCEKGSVAAQEPKVIRTIVISDKAKLKSKARRLKDRYDVCGPFRVLKTGGAFRRGPRYTPVPSLESMKVAHAARRAEVEAYQAKKEQLDGIQTAQVKAARVPAGAAN